jgi:uncharacterized protein
MDNSRSVALITGGSSGIGETFARHLAARGCDLILVARRTDRLAQLAAELKAAHGIAVETIGADLATDAGVAAVAERIAAEPRLDYLVNNAGFGTKGLFFQADIEGQDQMHRLHVMAAMRLTHVALRDMVKRGKGAVINVSSVAAFVKSAGGTSYSATKAWMNHFTEGLRLELKSVDSPVRVQALCPGYTYSEFHDTMGWDRGNAPKSWWMTSDFVVSESLKGLDRDQLFVVPGWRYKLLVSIIPKLPQGLYHWGAIRAGRKLRR